LGCVSCLAGSVSGDVVFWTRGTRCAVRGSQYGERVAEKRARSLRGTEQYTDHRSVSGERVEIRRSTRRRRTVSAYRDGGTLVVLMPAAMSTAQEEQWVAEMQRRLHRTERNRRPAARTSDAELLSRCAELAQRYLSGEVAPVSVRWVAPMRTRWASCTPANGTIRVSSRLRAAPSWVLDYVLVHELAHLRVAGHNAEFWELVHRYPKTERAIGYLEGLSAAAGWGSDDH